MRLRLEATLLATTLLLAGAPPARAGSGDGHVTWGPEACARCHAADPAAALAPRLARPCVALCASCHELRGGHHPVGVALSPGSRPPLLLTDDGRTTCCTCHDVTRPRVDGVAWASRSLFDRLARRVRESRTYYLVERNDRGQLCRACH